MCYYYLQLLSHSFTTCLLIRPLICIILFHSSKECQTIHWKTAHKSVCIILCAQSNNNSKQLSDLDLKQLKCVIKGKCNELKLKVDSDLDSKSKEELVSLGRTFYSLMHLLLIHILTHSFTHSLTYFLIYSFTHLLTY